MGLARGYLRIDDPDLGVFEADTFTCYHCQRVVWKKGEGGFCRVCGSMICSRCVGGDCVPFLKKIEQQEEAAYRRQQFEKVAGL